MNLVQSSSGDTWWSEEVWFAHARFANRPKRGTELNHANSVWASLTYMSTNGEILVGPIEGRWSGLQTPSETGGKHLIYQTLQSTGHIENLDIAAKPAEGTAWYAFNNRNYEFQRFVNSSYELTTDIVDVHIVLRGERVYQEFDVRMYNDGEGQGIRIEEHRSWLKKLISPKSQ